MAACRTPNLELNIMFKDVLEVSGVKIYLPMWQLTSQTAKLEPSLREVERSTEQFLLRDTLGRLELQIEISASWPLLWLRVRDNLDKMREEFEKEMFQYDFEISFYLNVIQQIKNKPDPGDNLKMWRRNLSLAYRKKNALDTRWRLFQGNCAWEAHKQFQARVAEHEIASEEPSGAELCRQVTSETSGILASADPPAAADAAGRRGLHRSRSPAAKSKGKRRA